MAHSSHFDIQVSAFFALEISEIWRQQETGRGDSLLDLQPGHRRRYPRGRFRGIHQAQATAVSLALLSPCEAKRRFEKSKHSCLERDREEGEEEQEQEQEQESGGWRCGGCLVMHVQQRVLSKVQCIPSSPPLLSPHRSFHSSPPTSPCPKRSSGRGIGMTVWRSSRLF
jgi:hypothetical protein